MTETQIDLDKIKLAAKFNYIGSMFSVAHKMLAELTSEEIAAAPYYVEYVLPNIVADTERDRVWCDNVATDIVKGAIKHD